MVTDSRSRQVERADRTKSADCRYVLWFEEGVQPAHASKLIRILGVLDVAQSAVDLAIPAFRAHELKGELAGYWSICVNGNRRVTFRFVGQDAELVDYQDYR
jgi:proteic killer suppression protein